MDSAAAKDVMQDTFIRVYENRERLLNTDSFKSWVYTIARNQCYNHLRKSKRHIPLADAPQSVVRVDGTPFGSLEKSDQVQMVNHLLSLLKVEYREVLILREYQNLSYEEIAAVTRTTVSSVKSRLFKARKKLAETYGAYTTNVDDQLNLSSKHGHGYRQV